jgi:co-chaperonin GroES (HSP10)
MTLTPINDLVLVQMDNRKTESDGGIAIPEFSQTTETWGQVARVGNSCERVIEGDEVYVPSHLGTHIVLQGADYVLIQESKILAKREVV